jgi:NAD(P)-dependent dehydrogenase (short-subunit alcohol dehydrogenase family)
MLLKDKVVIVSGIGPGLGQKLSTLAALEGAKAVILAARTASKLDIAEEEIESLGLGTETLKVPTDISERAQCKNLTDKTIETFGRIDVLLNSAFDPCTYEPIESANLDAWRATMEVNMFGSLNLTQEAVVHMKQSGGGSIVNIATMVERVPLPYQGGYAASKAALRAVTKQLALELGPYNIRANSCYMGWMWGPNVEGYVKGAAQSGEQTEEEIIADITRNIPLGFIPEDGDCAKAAIFFASDYSRVITGAGLDVNGGQHMPA